MNKLVIPSKHMSMISRLTSQYMNVTLKAYEINYTQFIILMTLYRKEGQIQEDISMQIFIDRGAVTRAIKDLEKKGYLIRKVGVLDKRSKKLYLTEKSILIEKELRDNAKRWTKILTNGINKEEQQTLYKQLEIMFANGEKTIRDIKS